MDKYWIDIATNLAYTNIGRTGYKPSVASVIVKDGVLLVSGVTSSSNGIHAEVVAINDARRRNVNLEGGTMYVTLEPCVHYGQTPPCVNAILEAKIANVVVGVLDPDPRVSGKGIEFLRQNGVNVTLLDDVRVRELYHSYFIFKNERRPYIVLKIAQSLDGKIATGNGVSKWITAEGARNYTNFLRSRFDGILIGGNTAKKDSPKLDCRVVGLEKFSPKKFVASINHFDGFVSVNGSVNEVVSQIYEHNIQHLLVEGGGNIITQFIKENLFDEILLIQAPIFIGNDGMSSVQDLGLVKIPTNSMQIIEKIEIDNNIILRLKNSI
jgi:diaminohydroxyphosphoribosylaminopyrimidine deaminase/5-amino-6-(5-phosphoribosylamino)uracil reductase